MPAASWSAHFNNSLQRIEAHQRLRARRVVDLRDAIDFGSNDYLGLRSHAEVLAALNCSAEEVAWGAGASPVLSGYSRAQATLEDALAQFSQADSALVFSSGYACNVGTVACLANPGDLILSDQLNHASLIDGCRLSKATTIVYPHGDVAFARDALHRQRRQYGKVMLLTESIFSMDGDAAPLVELADLAEQFDCGLVVDEAHAVGVYGQTGSGLLEELGLQARVLAKLGTLSKAIGCVGGYVVGEQNLIEYVVNHCRSFMFSTAAPARSLRAAEKALALLCNMHQSRLALRQRARDLRAALRQLGWLVPCGDSPIIPVVVGSEQDALQLQQHLWASGIYVPAIRPPTVPADTCRLRISLSTRHTPEECQRLVAALGPRH